MSFAGAGPGRDRRSASGTDRGRSRAGLKILIPGYPQWSWHQRERALVLFGSYLVALGVGLFSWGTPVGLVVLAFAYGTHVASATDVIRQEAFPGFGRWAPMISTSGGLGLGLYGPALALASLVAWPGMGDGLAGTDTWSTAVPTARPRRNMVTGFGFGRRPGAKAGSGGSWPGRVRRSNGRTSSSGSKASYCLPVVSWLPRQFPADLVLIVPGDHVLIAPVSSGSARTVPGTPVLVPCGEIVGRAWARYYPIRERQLLR